MNEKVNVYVKLENGKWELMMKDVDEKEAITSKTLKEQELKFVDNRLNAILGKGDDYGFDEYDLIER